LYIMQILKPVRSLALALPLVVGCGVGDNKPVLQPDTDEIVAVDTRSASRDSNQALHSRGNQGLGNQGADNVVLGESAPIPAAKKEPELTKYVPAPRDVNEDGNLSSLPLNEFGEEITHPVSRLAEGELPAALKAIGRDSNDFSPEEKKDLIHMAGLYGERSVNPKTDLGLNPDVAMEMAVRYVCIKPDLVKDGSKESTDDLKAARKATSLEQLNGILKSALEAIGKKKTDNK
jgi:hypothetical protein